MRVREGGWGDTVTFGSDGAGKTGRLNEQGAGGWPGSTRAPR